MRTRRTLLGTAAAAALTLSGAVATASSAAPAPTTSRQTSTTYLVLYTADADRAAVKAAIARNGGTVTKESSKLGYAFVTSSAADFASRTDAVRGVEGVARNRVIGTAPQARLAANSRRDLERMQAERNAAKGQNGVVVKNAATSVAAEPLADFQWDMRQIGATPGGSYAVDQGSKKVRVGIIDTGVDGTHPDIAPNFDTALSVNFVTDDPTIDGPCEYASCKDPANEDDDGHGTHVASTIGAPINGIGIAGVAPNVDLINIRAGQDSGFFFLQPTLNALEYAGDIGVDVVNMSFFTDPWLYNCTNNPADSPAERTEQRVIREATQRAVNYAIGHGVLPVAASGNEATDLGNPTTDDTSPDFPLGTAKHRDVDNSCITVPTETNGVLVVNSTGISTRKAYYSNWGVEQTDVAAPGGDVYDTPANTRDIAAAVLAAMPKNVAVAEGVLNPDGTPNTPAVVEDCENGVCAYYQYLQGTSMASPHAAGVAALVVDRLGKPDSSGVGLDPRRTRAAMFATAVPHACPSPRLFHYVRHTPSGATLTADAYCDGSIRFNGFYGHGIVNANNAANL